MQVILSNFISFTVVSCNSFSLASPGPCQLGSVATIILFNVGLCFYKVCFGNPLFSSVLASLSIVNFLWLQIFSDEFYFFSGETTHAANQYSIIPKLPHFIFIIKNKLNLELSKPMESLFLKTDCGATSVTRAHFSAMSN